MSEHEESCKRVMHAINVELARTKGKRARRELLLALIAYMDQVLVEVNKP